MTVGGDPVLSTGAWRSEGVWAGAAEHTAGFSIGAVHVGQDKMEGCVWACPPSHCQVEVVLVGSNLMITRSGITWQPPRSLVA